MNMFGASIELLTGTTLTCGNHAELCLNGDGTYDRLFADLASGEQTITLQMYYCQPGKIADRFADVMRERAKAGVRVLFLLDAFGSAKLTKEYLRVARAMPACEVAKFRPVNWYQLEKAYARSHIRVVVIDGCIGYTGGFGMDDKWLGDGRHERPVARHERAIHRAGGAAAAGDVRDGMGRGDRRAAHRHASCFPAINEDDTGGAMRATLLAHGADDRQHGRGATARALHRRRSPHALHHELVLRA